METRSPRSPVSALAIVAITATIGVLLAATLIGWSEHGTAILYTYAQDGLAWCF